MNELSRLHDDLCTAAKLLLDKKNADYTAGSSDLYANFRISAMFGVEPEVGVLIRCTDKLQRIRSFVESGELKVDDETVKDSVVDVINYMVLVYGLMSERREARCEKRQPQVNR